MQIKTFGEQFIEDFLKEVDYDIYKEYICGETEDDFSKEIDELNDLKELADMYKSLSE